MAARLRPVASMPSANSAASRRSKPPGRVCPLAGSCSAAPSGPRGSVGSRRSTFSSAPTSAGLTHSSRRPASRLFILRGEPSTGGTVAWYCSPTRDSVRLPRCRRAAAGDMSAPSRAFPACMYAGRLSSWSATSLGRLRPALARCVLRMPSDSIRSLFLIRLTQLSIGSARRSHSEPSTDSMLLPSERPTSRAAAASQLSMAASGSSISTSECSVRQRSSGSPGRVEG
mmetsp:Transcript_1201/g.2862  ORF Transcript_1201/g.2862 Transcript_1201/m.2862 type:complete len:228 (+) Transcript_1201:193-876(+)